MGDIFGVTVLGVELYGILWFFYLFSVLGVVLEMVFCFAREGVIESRLGILYLPLSPIYGVGAVVLSLFLAPYVSEPVLMFLTGMIVGSVLEYVVSWVMEKAFHSVFWDYSDRPLNIQGRVCLQYSIYWGLLSLLLLYVIDRWVRALVEGVDRDTGTIVLVVLSALTLVATALTLAAFVHIRRKIAALTSGAAAPASPLDRLIDRLAPDTVIINTFPRMSLITEYMALSGLQRRWIRLDLHLGEPSRLRRQMRDHADPRTPAAVQDGAGSPS